MEVLPEPRIRASGLRGGKRMALVNFSGIASGIDTASLIDALVEQKRAARVDPLLKSQDRDRETSDALKKLKDLLAELRSSADVFRTVNGGGLQTTATSSNEQVGLAKPFGGTAKGNYDITVSQLARNASLSFEDRFSSIEDAIAPTINDGASAQDRTLTFSVGTGDSQESIAIEINSSTSAADIVEAFNAQSTVATASLINLGSQSSPSYALNISSRNSGLEKGSLSVTSGAELLNTGVLSSTNISQASDAAFSISGVTGTINRATNSISDLIPGLSIDLEGVGTTRITVSESPDDTTERVSSFIDKYNDIIKFIQENDLVVQEKNGNETTNIFGALSSSSVDENVASTLRRVFSSASQGGLILADLGITSSRDGTLDFDQAKFQKTLSASPSAVGDLLESLGETLGGTNGKIAQFNRFQGIIDQALNSTEDIIRQREQRIADIEASLAKEEERLQGRFARLEGLIGTLNQQQSALASILPSS